MPDHSLKILTLTSLYPNSAQPRHGVFVEQRLRHLLARYPVEIRVVAPVPWFPSSHARFGIYGRYASAPKTAQRHGITISHPRYPVVPKLNIGMNISPLLLATSLLPQLKKIQREGFDFDVIDAHYYYPDGVAAVLLGQWLKKPVVVTARGNDLSLLPDYPVPKRWIQWAEKRAAASITVCAALRDRLLELGGSPERSHVLSNGVDLQAFQPLAASERQALRAELGLTRRTLIQVGHLIERKGQHLAIEALAQLPNVDLLLVGDGEERQALVKQAANLGVADRLRFVGEVSHTDIKRYMNAADALLLPSSREGLANVMLESLACGTPVVATAVWGAPEVITTEAAGVLIQQRSGAALAEGVVQLFDKLPSRQATRKHAEQFSWDATSKGLYELLLEVAGKAQQAS